MTRYNILWGILHGGSTTTQDWVRGTSEKLGPEGRNAAVRAILPDRDDSVRGWLVETIIRTALMSNVADDILKLDPVNTYGNPLSDPSTRLFTTRSNFRGAETSPFGEESLPVKIVEAPSASWTYKRTARYTFTNFYPGSETEVYADGTFTVSAAQPNGTTTSLSVTFDNGSAVLPFDGGSVQVSGIQYLSYDHEDLEVTYKALPKVNPVELLSNRMKSSDFRRDATELCFELLKEYR